MVDEDDSDDFPEVTHDEMLTSWLTYVGEVEGEVDRRAFDDCMDAMAGGVNEEAAWLLLMEIIARTQGETALADVGSHLIESYLIRPDARIAEMAALAKRNGGWAFALSMTWVKQPAKRKPDRYKTLRPFVRTIS